MGCEIAAEKWAGNARQSEDGAEYPLIPSTIARRHDVANYCLRRHGETAPTEPLDGPEEDQLGHVPAQSAERGSEEKQNDRALENPFAPIEITELPVERGDDGLGEEVCGDNPGEPR